MATRKSCVSATVEPLSSFLAVAIALPLVLATTLLPHLELIDSYPQKDQSSQSLPPKSG